MSDETVSQAPVVFSSKERSALVARALGEAARRARFSTKRRGMLSAGLRERRGAQLLRLLRVTTFFGIVVIPSLLFAAYIFLGASPQYSSEARFTVRGGMPTSLDEIGKSAAAPSMLIIQDTQVILNFMQSRGMVEALNKKIDFESLYERPGIDWLSRLKPDQAIERVVRYWKQHATISVQMPSGIVVFTVRAFSPEDAVTVTKAALATSEALVNEMNEKMRDDAVSLAAEGARRAETNLASARTTLERSRNQEGMLNASEESKGITSLIQNVQQQLLQMQAEYDSQRRYVRADAPQLRNLQTKIDAAQTQIEALKAQMTKPDAANVKPALSGSMSRLDTANLNVSIAEKIYSVALAALEQARIASESKLMYINTFVRPVAAQQAEYPKRPLDMLVFVLATASVWCTLAVGLSFVRRGLS